MIMPVEFSETPLFQYCFQVSDCSVQYAIRTKNSERTAAVKCLELQPYLSQKWFSNSLHMTSFAQVTNVLFSTAYTSKVYIRTVHASNWRMQFWFSTTMNPSYGAPAPHTGELPTTASATYQRTEE